MADAVPYLDLAGHHRPLRAEVESALARALDRNSFCLGPDVAQFEKDFAAFVGTAHCVALNSGTSALHLAARLANLGQGDEIITTPFTFAATAWAISYVGARPVFADIDEASFNLDPGQVEAAITPRTKALLVVHLYGQPCDLDPLLALCRKHQLMLIEDAAQAHGAKYRGRNVGTFGVTSCFSFYPTKNLGACGEGGALLTSDSTLAQRARALREHGSSERYRHNEVGYNYRMEGFQGAVLNVKLKHLAAWNAARRRVAQRYSELLAGTPLRLPHEAEFAESVWHLYVVRHPRRDELKRHLEAHRVGCAIHYPLPLHLQPCYAGLGYRTGAFPVAEQAASECLALPMFPELTEEQIQRVAGVIKNFFTHS